MEIETWPEAEIETRAFTEALWSAERSLLGDAGAAAVDLQVLQADFRSGGGSAIVRVRRDAVERARSTLACLSAVDGQPVRIGVRGVGGTVRSVREHYLGGPPEPTGTESVVYRGESAVAVRREDRVDVDFGDTFVGTTPQEL
ncbi:MAG: Rpp14/Pop5 family protein [Halodesulfurarchaeum sp.]|nr:Rpp14/Pop5 family protein [Halodesulfurarchaeum sp.]